ncbi:hypothetical protein BRCH_02774 [Candidatus Burkholderia brachyanthoides]|nr:hypothetical protein BRCH_02774 [Candidatus Burkholderia brachyanthoides]
MIGKPFKVQAVAKMLGTTVDSVRRMVVDAGIDVARQEHGPKTRLFSAENVFDLARYSSTKKAGTKGRSRKQVVATIYAPKGGVGKTTIAGNLACRFSLRGLKTLIVDLDFQGNLTMMYGFETEMTLRGSSGSKPLTVANRRVSLWKPNAELALRPPHASRRCKEAVWREWSAPGSGGLDTR